MTRHTVTTRQNPPVSSHMMEPGARARRRRQPEAALSFCLGGADSAGLGP